MIQKKNVKTIRFGIEFELFTLDEKGYMIDGADRLIKRVRREFPLIAIKEECAKNMIEIVTPPHTEVPDALLQALRDFQNVISCAAKEKIVLYAYGTYPGAFTPHFRTKKRYKIQEKIFGKQRFSIAGRCVGLHIHYSLPWGVFDSSTKTLKPLVNSKNKESLINMYNLAVAMDPALIALTQSSPFYQGERKGKDARVLMYRGGTLLSSEDGLYANHQEFGGLPGYAATNADLLHLIEERSETWKGILKDIGEDIKSFKIPGTTLSTNWSPVRVNQHGTIELRGMDMNHPDVIVAAAALIKFIFKAIQERYLEVEVSDTAIADPFRFDGTMIKIPPASHVRSILQKAAAYEGLENETVQKYANNLIRLAKNFMPAEKLVLLKPFEEMLREKKTPADRILGKIKEYGWKPDALSDQQAAELASDLSSDLYEEIDILEERLEDFIETNQNIERIPEKIVEAK